MQQKEAEQLVKRRLRSCRCLVTPGCKQARRKRTLGGEEFVMRLPGLPELAANERAKEWRQRFANLGLLRFGEQALYKAKTGGRNRVVSHAPAEAVSATTMPASLTTTA